MTKHQATYAATALVARLADHERAEVVRYHSSDKTEGRSLGEFFGFIDQPIRHAALSMLGVHKADF